MSQDFFYGTGKRKTSVSRTRLYKGTGTITVNGRELGDYFPRATLQMIIRQPLKLTKTLEKFNIACRVTESRALGSHTMFIAEVVGVTVDDEYLDENDRFHINDANLIMYSHGEYFALGKYLGKFGYSVQKKKKRKK